MAFNIHAFHDARFDADVLAAHSFVTSELGLGTLPPSRVTVVPESNKAFRNSLFGHHSATQAGGYNPETRDIALIARPDLQNPNGATHRLRSYLVHELTHPSTYANGEHKYWNEIIPGIAEHRYLRREHETGRLNRASDFILHRAGVQLYVPGTFRHYDRPAEQGANSSNALIAAMGFAMTQPSSNVKAADLFGASNGNRYALLKRSFSKLDQGLVTEIENLPESTDGIIQATALVYDAYQRRAKRA